MGFNEKLIYIVTIISLVFVPLSGLIFTFGTIYNVPTDEKYQQMFNNYEATTDTIEISQQIIQGGDVNPEGFSQAVYPNSISVGKQMVTSSNLFIDFINEIPQIILIPAAVISIIIFLVSVASLFGFIKYLNDRTP